MFMYLGDNEMENKSLNNSVKYESLVQQLAEEFVKTHPEGVAKLFNNDVFGAFYSALSGAFYSALYYFTILCRNMYV